MTGVQAERCDIIRSTVEFYGRLSKAAGILLLLIAVGMTGGGSAGIICGILGTLYVWRFARSVMRSPASAAVRRGRLVAALMFVCLPVFILTAWCVIIAATGR